MAEKVGNSRSSVVAPERMVWSAPDWFYGSGGSVFRMDDSGPLRRGRRQ